MNRRIVPTYIYIITNGAAQTNSPLVDNKNPRLDQCHSKCKDPYSRGHPILPSFHSWLLLPMVFTYIRIYYYYYYYEDTTYELDTTTTTTIITTTMRSSVVGLVACYILFTVRYCGGMHAWVGTGVEEILS